MIVCGLNNCGLFLWYRWVSIVFVFKCNNLLFLMVLLIVLRCVKFLIDFFLFIGNICKNKLVVFVDFVVILVVN